MNAPIAPFLAGVAEHVRDSPTDADDAAELLDAVHDMDAVLTVLHAEAAGRCGAPMDRYGRCADCGRLMQLPQAHRRRGCMSLVIPGVRMVTLAMSIPVLGKLLWLALNRADVGPIASSPDDVAVQPSAAAGAGRALPQGPGRAVHAEVEQ